MSHSSSQQQPTALPPPPPTTPPPLPPPRPSRYPTKVTRPPPKAQQHKDAHGGTGFLSDHDHGYSSSHYYAYPSTCHAWEGGAEGVEDTAQIRAHSWQEEDASTAFLDDEAFSIVHVAPEVVHVDPSDDRQGRIVGPVHEPPSRIPVPSPAPAVHDLSGTQYFPRGIPARTSKAPASAQAEGLGTEEVDPRALEMLSLDAPVPPPPRPTSPPATPLNSSRHLKQTLKEMGMFAEKPTMLPAQQAFRMIPYDHIMNIKHDTTKALNQPPQKPLYKRLQPIGDIDLGARLYLPRRYEGVGARPRDGEDSASTVPSLASDADDEGDMGKENAVRVAVDAPRRPRAKKSSDRRYRAQLRRHRPPLPTRCSSTGAPSLPLPTATLLSALRRPSDGTTRKESGATTLHVASPSVYVWLRHVPRDLLHRAVLPSAPTPCRSHVLRYAMDGLSTSMARPLCYDFTTAFDPSAPRPNRDAGL